MSTILEKANEILTEKKSKILPANIKAGIQIFDIVGTLEELNTSDATATAEDIIEGKTAYVNGEKIEGEMSHTEGYSTGVSNVSLVINAEGAQTLQFTSHNTGDMNLLLKNATIDLAAYDYIVAEAIGLTAEKILEGNTILGIVGTGKSGEDLQAQLDAQDILIAEQQAKIEELTALLEGKAEEV